MTLYQFRALDEIKQAETIWEKAVLLCELETSEYKHMLYQIDGFYVELNHHLKDDMINGARVFSNPDHLAPYLEQMEIAL
jgi:hypothetical protein